MQTVLSCPCCGRPVALGGAEASRFRPFCSERCRLIDLGQWAEGAYAIPAHRGLEAGDDAMDGHS